MSNAVVTDWPSGSANAGWPQEPTGMLMPGRVQGWPAGTQRASNAAQRLLSQAVAWWDVEQYRDGDRFLRNRGTAGELLDLRLGSSIVANSNDPRYLAPEDRGYVYMPGVSGNFLSVPDEAALDITGDIDIRACVTMDDWTPAAVTVLVGKWDTGTARAYALAVNTDGTLRFWYSTNGVTAVARLSTAATGITDGDTRWVRVTLDANDGAGNNVVTFYTSVDGSSWNQLGNTVTTAGALTLFSGSAKLLVGAGGSSANLLAGRVFRAQVLDGINGTTVLDIDCDAITSGSATSFTAVTNQTVTINRSTSGRKSVAVPSRHKGGRPLFLLGSDDFLTCVDNWQHGLLNLGQGDQLTMLAIIRPHASITSGQIIMGKTSSNAATATAKQWFFRYTASNAITTYLDDGVTINSRAATATPSALTVFASTVSASTIASYIGNTASASLARTFSDARNTLSFTVGGANGSTTGAADFEFYGAAIFRRALSPAEITTLSNYFTGRIA